MSLFHFNMSVIGRSDGRSATAAAAYRAGEKIKDERTGIISDYSKKSDIVYSNILMPDTKKTEEDNALLIKYVGGEILDDVETARAVDIQKKDEAVKAKMSNRSTLWNTVEMQEKHPRAQTARDLTLALQNELSIEEQIPMLEDFLQKNFVDEGMIVDLNIHHGKNKDGQDNAHAHVMISMRNLTPDGFGKTKNRTWNNKDLIPIWRESWANHINKIFEDKGIDESVSHLSNEDQGIATIPQIHRGQKTDALNKEGIINERMERYNAIEEANKEIILVKEITEKIALAEDQTYNDYQTTEAIKEFTADVPEETVDVFVLSYQKQEQDAELKILKGTELGKHALADKQKITKEQYDLKAIEFEEENKPKKKLLQLPNTFNTILEFWELGRQNLKDWYAERTAKFEKGKLKLKQIKANAPARAKAQVAKKHPVDKAIFDRFAQLKSKKKQKNKFNKLWSLTKDDKVKIDEALSKADKFYKAAIDKAYKNISLPGSVRHGLAQKLKIQKVEAINKIFEQAKITNNTRRKEKQLADDLAIHNDNIKLVDAAKKQAEEFGDQKLATVDIDDDKLIDLFKEADVNFIKTKNGKIISGYGVEGSDYKLDGSDSAVLDKNIDVKPPVKSVERPQIQKSEKSEKWEKPFFVDLKSFEKDLKDELDKLDASIAADVDQKSAPVENDLGSSTDETSKKQRSNKSNVMER